MALTPLPLVAPPARLPLPYGLFSTLAWRPATGGDRWEVGGVRWEEFTCEPLGDVGSVVCDSDDIPGLPLELEKLGTEVSEAKTFSVYGHYTCSPIGNSIDYANDQAVRQLELREEASVEQKIWSASTTGNAPLLTGSPDIPDLGEFDLRHAVAELEQWIAETYGSQGVLHMSRKNVSLMFKEGRLEKRGGRLYTPLDTPVVAGTGYGSDMVAVTGQLIGYRSGIFPGDQGVNFLDRAKNNLTAVAQRTYLIGFDQECAQATATIAADTP